MLPIRAFHAGSGTTVTPTAPNGNMSPGNNSPMTIPNSGEDHGDARTSSLVTNHPQHTICISHPQAVVPPAPVIPTEPQQHLVDEVIAAPIASVPGVVGHTHMATPPLRTCSDPPAPPTTTAVQEAQADLTLYVPSQHHLVASSRVAAGPSSVPASSVSAAELSRVVATIPQQQPQAVTVPIVVPVDVGMAAAAAAVPVPLSVPVPVPVPPAGIFCAFCGGRLVAATANFCTYCGQPVRANDLYCLI